MGKQKVKPNYRRRVLRQQRICDPKHVSPPEGTHLVEVGEGHRPHRFRRCSEAELQDVMQKAKVTNTERSHTVAQGSRFALNFDAGLQWCAIGEGEIQDLENSG